MVTRSSAGCAHWVVLDTQGNVFGGLPMSFGNGEAESLNRLRLGGHAPADAVLKTPALRCLADVNGETVLWADNRSFRTSRHPYRREAILLLR